MTRRFLSIKPKKGKILQIVRFRPFPGSASTPGQYSARIEPLCGPGRPDSSFKQISETNENT
jgi:hypothetical protein